MYDVLLPLQAETLRVHDRIVLKLYDMIWDVRCKLACTNLRMLIRCDYCGKVKVKVIENVLRKIMQRDPDHCKHIPHGRDNLYVTQNLKSRQVRICHDCIDSMI
jgi:hypothetical protein